MPSYISASSRCKEGKPVPPPGRSVLSLQSASGDCFHYEVQSRVDREPLKCKQTLLQTGNEVQNHSISTELASPPSASPHGGVFCVQVTRVYRDQGRNQGGKQPLRAALFFLKLSRTEPAGSPYHNNRPADRTEDTVRRNLPYHQVVQHIRGATMFIRVNSKRPVNSSGVR